MVRFFGGFFGGGGGESSFHPEEPEKLDIGFEPVGVPESLDIESKAKPDIIKSLGEDKKVDAILENPEVLSYTTIAFTLPEYEGRELPPDRRLAFVVPEKFRGRVVRDVVLHHRKGEKYCKDFNGKWDPHGAYSRVELYDSKTDKWREWRDPAGYSPDKFAEPRHAGDPEEEVLHDWVATVGEIKPDAVRVTNVGQSEIFSTSQIHGVELVFFPELEGVSYKERIYCSGTQFVDFEKGIDIPSYGGGEHTYGKYIGAMALNRYGKADFELGEDPGLGVEKSHNRLSVNLDEGKKLVQVEVAVGDTEYRGPSNSVRLGWAKLWVGIERARTGQVDWFVKNANIPPQGVIAGGPHLENAIIEKGDRLVIESRADASYVMGWRLAYGKNKESFVENQKNN
ncbi:MAG: hypothetical protein UT32_C0045G0003 [Parcubacteria group bacterium GW2011_GWC2_39_14]|nr:MAG: hypothetical protein UT32_C0045G0003 [Parcubacteria group bacterium GW2011_GWC2_39_14]